MQINMGSYVYIHCKLASKHNLDVGHWPIALKLNGTQTIGGQATHSTPGKPKLTR
jgi:hypothetical protein